MGGYPQRITSPDATLIAEVFEDPDSPAVLAPLICDAVNAYAQLRELEHGFARRTGVKSIRANPTDGAPEGCVEAELSRLREERNTLAEQGRVAAQRYSEEAERRMESEARCERLREERDAARGELREMRDDRDEGWRQHNQAEIGRLNAEAKLRRAIATLEYMGGAELVVDELRHGSLPEPSEDEAWEKRSRER